MESWKSILLYATERAQSEKGCLSVCDTLDDVLVAYTRLMNPESIVTSFPVMQYKSAGGFKILSPIGNERNRRNQIDVILQDVEPVPISRGVKYYEVGVEDEFLQPYKLDKSEKSKILQFRARQETAIHNVTAFPRTLAAIALGIGINFMTNPLIQRMKWYLSGLSSPYFKEIGSEIQVECEDLMVATRCQTLMMCAFFLEISKNEFGPEIFVEVGEFLFDNPFVHVKKLKDLRSLARQSSFALSIRGEMPKWAPFNYNDPFERLTSYVDSPIEGNDMVYYEFVKDKLNEDFVNMEAEGLFVFREKWMHLLHAPVTGSNLRLNAMMNALEAAPGYLRSLAPISHEKQVEIEGKLKSKPVYSQYLEREYIKMIEWAADERRRLIPSYREFRRLVPAFLTSRSAGGSKIALVWDVNGRKYSQRYTDKRMLFLYNPEYYLTKSVVEQGYDENEDTYGRIGSRQTVAKATRAIFMRRCEHYLHEIPFALPLQEYQMDIDVGPEDDIYSPGTSHDFTIGKESGNVFSDMSSLFAATTDSNIAIEMKDFSAFDSWQGEANMRRYARQGIIIGLERCGLTSPWGDFSGGLPELINLLWGKGHTEDAVYKSATKLSTTDKIERTLVLDQVQSGELMTLSINNMTNRANTSSENDLLDRKGLSDLFKLRRIRYQGDDSIGFWQLVTPSRYTSGVHSLFVNTKVENAANNGLVLNAYKTAFRLYMGEYLKKFAIYGYYLPLRHIQPFSSERAPKPMLATETMISYASLMSAYVARGADHDIMFRIFLYVSNFRRNVKIIDRENGNAFYYFPAASIFSPISLKGGGQLPYTFMSANKDTVIAYECSLNSDYRNLVNIAGDILNTERADLARTIAKIAMTHSDFEAGIKYMHDQLIPDRVRKSYAAAERLRKIGIRVPNSMYYVRSAESQVEESIKSSPNCTYLDNVSNTNSGIKYLRRYVDILKVGVRDVINDEFPWIDDLRVAIGDELTNWKEHEVTPLACLDSRMRDIALKYGVGSSRSAYAASPASVLSILRKDPFFPRNIRPEQIFAYLTTPSILRDPDLISTALVMMGAASDIAEKVASSFHVGQKAFMFRSASSAFSLNDQFIPMLALDYDNHHRVVDVTDFPDTNIRYFIIELGFLISVLNACGGFGCRKVQITLTEKLITSISDSFYKQYSNADVFRYSTDIMPTVERIKNFERG